MVDPRKVRSLLGRLAERSDELTRYAERDPSAYVLEEHGLLPGDLATRLSAAAGFRNLLVHEYARIDDGRVHIFLTEGLDDLQAFAAAAYDAFPEL